MTLTPERPLTVTGTWPGAKVVKVPSPRSPDSPSAQHLTVPSVMSAHPNSSPAEIWLTLVSALAPRVDELSSVPLACWPNWLRPTHWTVPSGRLTQVYSPPADTPLGV